MTDWAHTKAREIIGPVWVTFADAGNRQGCGALYDRIVTALRQAHARGIEEAARVAESCKRQAPDKYAGLGQGRAIERGQAFMDGCDAAELAIRALASKEPGDEG